MQELNRFNAISRWYDRLAGMIFGDAILNAQLHLIREILPDSRILILGGGTGKILPQLLSDCAGAEVWFIEASSEMIRRAASRVNGSRKVHFIHGTHLDIPPIDFDVVMGCFFLDLFSPPVLKSVIECVSMRLKASGKLLVSDFVAEAYWHKALLVIMYWLFSLVSGLRTNTLPPWNEILPEHGFSRLSEKNFYRGFIKSVCFGRSD